MLDLQPIKARLALATPGPWWCDATTVSHSGIRADLRTGQDWLFANDGATEADSELVANAPSDIAALIAEVERLRKELHQAHRELLSDKRVADDIYRSSPPKPAAIKRKLAVALEWCGARDWDGTCCVSNEAKILMDEVEMLRKSLSETQFLVDSFSEALHEAEADAARLKNDVLLLRTMLKAFGIEEEAVKDA